MQQPNQQITDNCIILEKNIFFKKLQNSRESVLLDEY